MMGIVNMKSIGVVVPLGNKSFFIEKSANDCVLRPDWSSGWRECTDLHEAKGPPAVSFHDEE